jgi:prolyl oligopeptidase
MNRFKIIIFISILAMFSACNTSKIDYPETRKDDVVETYFGTEVADPYRWLEDDNSEETEAWVKAQNAVTEEYFANIEFQAKIKTRLDELTNYERMIFNAKRGDSYFYFKNSGLQDHNVLYIKRGAEGAEEVLLDPNTFSEDGSASLAQISVSETGEFLVYAISQSGSDWKKLHILNTNTMEVLPDVLTDIKFTLISWHKDGFFYSKFDNVDHVDKLTAKNTQSAIYYHKLNTPQSADELIFTNTDEGDRYYYAEATKKYLAIYEQKGTYGNQLYLKNLENQRQNVFRLTSGFNYEYEIVTSIGDKLYIMTNYRSPRYRMAEVDLSTMAIGEWQDIIPEANGILKEVKYIGGKFIALYLDDVQHKIKVFDTEGNEIKDVELPGAGTVTVLNGESKSPTLMFGFTSYTSPETIYEYNLETQVTSTFFEPNVDIDLDNLVSELQFYESKDGTKIPMYLVHNIGLSKNKKNPAFLYGYGGFNVTVMPRYRAHIILWAEMGGVYAHAHLRGGSEYGEGWHQAGMKLNKQNVFDDFIAAGEYLISESYTNPKKLAIHGGSNGGLLVGAVTNQRPDLFEVAVPAVGVMDMLRYHKFTIGWAWASDYGTSEDSVHFNNLYAYSPLHNISEEKDYPAVLVLTADHDDRVVPAHSFKYIATLQEKSTSKEPALIRIQTKAGHGAGVPISVKNEETADIIAFMLYNMDENF